MKLKGDQILKVLLACSALVAFAAPVSAEKLLCQRLKAKVPQNRSVVNLKIVKGDKCPAGFFALGYLLEQKDIDVAVSSALTTNALSGPKGEKGDKGDKGDTGAAGPQGVQGDAGLQGETGPQGPQGEQGVQGVQGEQGEQGAQGNPGIVNIDACYTKTELRTGVLDETETVYCNNPGSEYIQHIGHAISLNDVFTTHETLEFSEGENTYTHPVGGTIRAFRHSGIIPYTLTVTVLCCPISQS